MNNLPETSTTHPAVPPTVNAPPSKDTEQVARAFAGGKQVKPYDTDNEHSECPQKMAGPFLQERTVALVFGERFTLLREKADALTRNSFTKTLSSHNTLPKLDLLKLDDVLELANEVLSYPPEQNWSTLDAWEMHSMALYTVAHLYFHLSEFPSESEIIEQKISGLRRYISMLEKAYELNRIPF